MRLIQINNVRAFFKFILLLWSLFNLQMYTHMYKFKPFPILFYLEHLSAVVFGKQECRDMYLYLLPSESIYVPVFMCVFKFSPKPED